MKYPIVLVIVLLSFGVQAQFIFLPDTSVHVLSMDGQVLINPWAGGLNAGQYSKMDLDGDGVEDLVVFDRTAQRVMTFLRRDNSWVHSPYYESFFPRQVRNWMLLRDYNGDGKKDLFTQSVFGMAAYKNVTPHGEPPRWELMADPIITKIFSNTGLQMNSGDIPAIVDVDGDGDLDILVYFFTGTGGINWHKNMSMERYGHAEALEFERVTEAWGDFYECICGQFSFGQPCDDSQEAGRIQHIAGKSLLVADLNGSGLLDAVMTEEECTRLYFLPNQGSADEALMTDFTTDFPNALNPTFFYIFPAAFYEDVDADGLKDLLIAPNVASNINNSVDFKESSHFYRNTGTAENPAFSLVQRNFLQGDMIELGDQASPAFLDLDNDGDLDMLVTSAGERTHLGFVSRIHYYENIGSNTQPKFQLRDTDWLGLSQLNFRNLRLQVADINGDNRPDLLLVGSQNFQFGNHLFYLLNGSASRPSFNANQIERLTLNLLPTDNPYFFDVTGNGRLDMLVGKEIGNLMYYENTGSYDNPQFTLREQNYYGLTPSTLRRHLTLAVADMDGDGKADLITGEQGGVVKMYPDFRGTLSNPVEPVFLSLESPLKEEVDTLNLGGRVRPVAVNLFGTRQPALMVGTFQGGLRLLRNTEASPNVQVSLRLFPNPVGKTQGDYLYVITNRNLYIDIIAANGKYVSSNIPVPGNTHHPVDISTLAEGLYIVRAHDGIKTLASARLVVVRKP
jgi:hypothetical protein